MKKDFTTPFEPSDHIKVSLLIESADKAESIFVLAGDPDEYGEYELYPPYVEVVTNNDPTLQIAKFLYENGLILNNLRLLLSDTEVQFSLVDETPGTTRQAICYHAIADLSKETRKNLTLVTVEEFEKIVDLSSFFGDLERSAARILLNTK